MPKRSATTQLNRDNWDDEEEPEEMGVFKKATKEDLSKRIIRTGKRRQAQSSSNGKPVFARFGGFGVPQNNSNNPFSNLFGNVASNSNQSGKLDDKTNSSENDIGSNGDDKDDPTLSKPVFNSDIKSFSSLFKNGNNDVVSSKEESKEPPKVDKQKVYLSKLKGLNETLLDWIKSHIEQNPTCILTPVFTDYDNYLKEIRTERDSGQKNSQQTNEQKIASFSTFKFTKLPTMNETTTESLTNCSPLKKLQKEDISTNKNKPASFVFGSSSLTNPILSSSSTSNFNMPSLSKVADPSKPAPFQSGNIGSETTNDSDKEDEVAGEKYNLVPVVEEEALFSQRVKLFVKNDNNYADRGVGMLYIKNVSGKHQAIVRADTNLGNILMNIILNKDIPSERVGKNNVTLVCVPTPDSKPSPVPILLRVKTEQEADKLFEVINKYKNAEGSNND